MHFMEMNFCRRCGSPLSLVANGHVFRCSAGHTIYLNASPSVGIFLIDTDNKLLLSVRGIEPNKGMLDAFGGFLDGEETVEAALERELYEELGLKPSDYMAPVYITSGIGHYLYGDETLPVLSSLFYARLNEAAIPTPQDDVAEIFRAAMDDIVPSQLHDEDVRTGFIRLKQLL